MTSLTVVAYPLPLPLAGPCIALLLSLTGCLPPPNDLGDTATTNEASTTSPPDSTTTGTTPEGATSLGSETGPLLGGTSEFLDDASDEGSSTAVATDTGVDTETDGEPLPPTVFDCALPEPCISPYFGCSNHMGCEDEPPPEWGPGPLCMLELARDIRTMPGASAEINFERGGSPDWITIQITYLLSSDGTVLTQHEMIDTKFGTNNLSSPRQCVLQQPEYFQACLDDPQYSCGESEGWITDCVDLVEFECPGA